MSALVIAVTHGHMEITKLLLEQSSVHVNIRTDVSSPFNSYRFDYSVLRSTSFVSQLSSSKWYAGYTPLMFAIYNCHFCVANALLDHFDVNVNLLNEVSVITILPIFVCVSFVLFLIVVCFKYVNVRKETQL